MMFAFVGDLHIRKMANLMGMEVGLRRQIKLLTTQLGIFHSRGVEHVAFMGDIFDGPYPTQEELVAVIKVLSDKRFQFLVYHGNHDVDDAAHNSLKLLQELPAAGALTNVTFVSTPQVVDWCNMRVFVMPWAPRYAPIKDRVDLILFHGDLVGAKRDTGMTIPAGEGLTRSFFRGITAVSGHLHTPQRYGNIYFCGTSAQLSFGERPEKRLFYGEKRDGKVYISSFAFEPHWRLETVAYDVDNPPACDVPGTFYSLDVSAGRPGPRWLSEHPAVMKIKGSSKKIQAELTKEVARLTSGTEASDTDLLKRWLRENSSLSKAQRAHGVQIDRSLA